MVSWGPLGPSSAARAPKCVSGQFLWFFVFPSFWIETSCASKDHSRKQNIHNKLYNLYNVACCMLPFNMCVCYLSSINPSDLRNECCMCMLYIYIHIYDLSEYMYLFSLYFPQELSMKCVLADQLMFCLCITIQECNRVTHFHVFHVFHVDSPLM